MVNVTNDQNNLSPQNLLNTVDVLVSENAFDFITTMTFSTLGALLYQDKDVLLIRVGQVQDLKVSVIFKKKDVSRYHECVLWDQHGSSDNGSSYYGWSFDRCFVSKRTTDTVTCRCSGLSTFSVLGTEIFWLQSNDRAVTFGAGANVFFILICLIIEGCVWKSITTNSTALMRHVTIINTSICLLVGDILLFCVLCFRHTFSVCFLLIFFWQVFDLALFFWMLVSCLLLFYRTSFVFSNMSKAKMFAIGFSLGYGAPLLIVIITVASTAPNHSYISQGFCMLDWVKSMTVLSSAVPILTIALVNVALMIVVLFNIKRSTRATNRDADERRNQVVRLVFLLISFLLFGLTRGLALGMLYNLNNTEVYIAFAVSNSLQVRKVNQSSVDRQVLCVNQCCFWQPF
uniref:G-protein coupled receptors family 2 profile 2 domain-containing protein n=1 Tax=Neogobius melanostomus TaxID=47308 RepID=A0A8C6TQQ5_9GOBI